MRASLDSETIASDPVHGKRLPRCKLVIARKVPSRHHMAERKTRMLRIRENARKRGLSKAQTPSLVVINPSLMAVSGQSRHIASIPDFSSARHWLDSTSAIRTRTPGPLPRQKNAHRLPSMTTCKRCMILHLEIWLDMTAGLHEHRAGCHAYQADLQDITLIMGNATSAPSSV